MTPARERQLVLSPYALAGLLLGFCKINKSTINQRTAGLVLQKRRREHLIRHGEDSLAVSPINGLALRANQLIWRCRINKKVDLTRRLPLICTPAPKFDTLD